MSMPLCSCMHSSRVRLKRSTARCVIHEISPSVEASYHPWPRAVNGPSQFASHGARQDRTICCTVLQPATPVHSLQKKLRAVPACPLACPTPVVCLWSVYCVSFVSVCSSRDTRHMRYVRYNFSFECVFRPVEMDMAPPKSAIEPTPFVLTRGSSHGSFPPNPLKTRFTARLTPVRRPWTSSPPRQRSLRWRSTRMAIFLREQRFTRP